MGDELTRAAEAHSREAKVSKEFSVWREKDKSFRAGWQARDNSSAVRGLRDSLRVALRHAEELYDGCLYCGVDLDLVYDENGNVLESHRKSCWHYVAEDAIAAFEKEVGK